MTQKTTPNKGATGVPLDKIVMRYWYKTCKKYCPVCGEEDEYKYRVYGDKPKDPADRIEHAYINHYCDA